MTSGLHILVVDDEPPIRKLLQTSLGAQQYRVSEAGDGASACETLRKEPFDAVVLDLGMPGMDGFEVIQRLRREGNPVPIIVLSAQSDEAGKVKALDMGADDYVTKPFGMDELLARLRAAVRHRLQQSGERPVFKTGDLVVDLIRRVVLARGKEVKLTPREYDLLRVLVANAGKVLTHKYLMHALWGPEADIQYLRIYIRMLRQKIEADPDQPTLILTEQGVGYRLRLTD